MPIDRGIVEYFGCTRDEHPCGYCKGTKPSLSDFGMWAHQLKSLEYLQLMERGWRRSGKYCYKPILNRTCCPPYTIRCDAPNFTPSRSQRKSLKRLYHFLKEGRVGGQQSSDGRVNFGDHQRNRSSSSMSVDTSSSVKELEEVAPALSLKMTNNDKSSIVTSSTFSSGDSNKDNETTGKDECNDASSLSTQSTDLESMSTCGVAKPSMSKLLPANNDDGQKFGKSRVRRFERKLKKIMACGNCSREEAISIANRQRQEKIQRNMEKNQRPLEDLMKFVSDSCIPEQDFKHRLSIKFLSTSFVGRKEQEKEFKDKVLDVEHQVYEKYQMTVHKDEPDECNKKQFTRFLVDSPILLSPFRSQLCQLRHEGIRGFGSYHMQYWLDGKILIAVSVIDILPTGLSSVYFFYDPAYSFLGLGTYSALQEILLVRDVVKVYLPFRYYYMGFYIHSCPKMRYKGRYHPSFLLCPEVKTWIPIRRAVPLLDKNKYSRLEPDDSKVDEDSRGVRDEDIGVFYAGNGITAYNVYASLKDGENSNDSTTEEKVREYASLVGKKCVKSMLVYLE